MITLEADALLVARSSSERVKRMKANLCNRLKMGDCGEVIVCERPEISF